MWARIVCGVLAPSRGLKTQLWRASTEASGKEMQRAHGVLNDREEVVRGDVNKDTMQVRHHGRESVTKGTMKTGIDFTGKPMVE